MEKKARRSKKAGEAAIDAILKAVCEEHKEELDALCEEYIEHYAPDTEEEVMVLETLACYQWRQRCLNRVEARIWTEEMEKAEDPQYALGEAWSKRSADFMRIQRRMDADQRSYDKTHREWERLRAARKAARTRPVDLAELPSASRWRM